MKSPQTDPEHREENAEAVVETIKQYFGEMTRHSDWLTVDQPTMERFAQATGDFDWIHTDPQRARRESPFGGTIAFGFWTVSMLTYFLRQITGGPYPPGVRFGLNYGFDRLRLTAPVPVGKRIRAASKLLSVKDRGGGHYLVKTENRIEVEGEAKPALFAEWLIMLVFDRAGTSPEIESR